MQDVLVKSIMDTLELRLQPVTPPKGSTPESSMLLTNTQSSNYVPDSHSIFVRMQKHVRVVQQVQWEPHISLAA